MTDNWMGVHDKEKVVNTKVADKLEDPLRMLTLATENLLMVETLLKEIEAKLVHLNALPDVSGGPAHNYPLNGFKKVGHQMDTICPLTSAKGRSASL